MNTTYTENLPTKDWVYLVKLYKNGKFEEVLQKTEQLKLKYSTSIKLHNLIGTVNALLENYDAAINSYNKILSINPHHIIALNNLGNVFKETGDCEIAIKNYREAIKLKPEYTEAHYNIGIAFYEHGDFGQAQEYLYNSIRLKQNYPEAYYALGLTFEKSGNNLLAIQNFENAINLKPDYVEAFFSLGNILKKNGEYELAAKNYKKALKIDKNYFKAYCNLGNVEKDLGNKKLAKLNYKKALEINSKDIETLWNLHGIAETVDEAILWLDKCLKIDKNCIKAKLTFSALNYLKNDKIEFQNLMKTDIKSHPFMRSFLWTFKLNKIPKIFFDKFSLFNYVIKNSYKKRPFYEFGVWKGASFKYLIQKIKKGYGFDTFTGLPETWYNEKPGTYSNDGIIPKVEGGEFITGKFEESLPNFFKKNRPLASIINFDADLYSSTLCALQNCRSIIDHNTILVFDEFLMSDRWEEDEHKALNEFCDIYNLSYEVIAVSFFSKQVAVKIIESNK